MLRAVGGLEIIYNRRGQIVDIVGSVKGGGRYAYKTTIMVMITIQMMIVMMIMMMTITTEQMVQKLKLRIQSIRKCNHQNRQKIID
jgi:hypothetical protein